MSRAHPEERARPLEDVRREHARRRHDEDIDDESDRPTDEAGERGRAGSEPCERLGARCDERPRGVQLLLLTRRRSASIARSTAVSARAASVRRLSTPSSAKLLVCSRISASTSGWCARYWTTSSTKR